MKSIRSRLSYTNVMSTIAVFGVLAGGGAWEASKIGTNDIKKGAVTVKKLHQNAVTTKKIKDNAVTGDKVNEPTLGQVPSALLGGFGGSSANVFCNPESGAFTACASTENLDVPPGAAALVLGHVNGGVDANATKGIGDCRLSASSTGAFPTTRQTFKVHPDETSTAPSLWLPLRCRRARPRSGSSVRTQALAPPGD